MDLMDFIRSKDIKLLYFDLAIKEYQDLWDSWRLVEAKAQPLSAICSAFLAGVLAYGQIVNEPPACLERILLFAIGLTLFYSICRFILAIRVVSAESPFLGNELLREIDALGGAVDVTTPLEKRYEASLVDWTQRYITACENLRPLLTAKHKNLNGGLSGLALSAALAVALMAIKLIQE